MPRSCIVPALLLVLLAAPASSQVQNIGSNVAVNTTWGPTGTVVGTVFRITSSISINTGVTLTIQPGVVVKFDGTRSLTVNGTLSAVGTAGSNIVFTSVKDDAVGGDTNGDGNATVPASQDWGRIVFPDASPDNSVLTYCDLRYGGYSSAAILEFENSSHAVTNCVIRRGYYGIDCQGTAAPSITGTSIEASTQTPIVLDFTAAPVLSSLVFSSANNGYDAFGLRGATLGGAATLPRRGATVGANPITNVTYVLLGSLTINSGGSLTVNPGVVIKPTSTHTITVNSGGTLTMNGTATPGDTITITSIHDDNFGQPSDTNNNGSITAPSAGNWGRIVFNAGSTGSLSRCRLKFGSNTATAGMVEMTSGSIPVSNCLLSDAAHGLALFGTSSPAVTNVEIDNCTSAPVLMSVRANPAFTGVGLLGNAITAIGLDGESIGVDAHIVPRTLGGYANITYYLMNDVLTVQSPAVLTIDPGIVIKNQINSGGFVIDGALVADGTALNPIVFTSVRDDAYGNPPDTNGDGSSSVPAQANWSYIRFTATSNDAVSKLDYCRIAYASNGPGDGWNTSLWISSASPPVTNCTITRGAYGIRIDGDSAPLIDACDINNCQYAPFVMSPRSDPTITNDTFSTNGYNAIALFGETLTQNARIRYRPTVGPPGLPVFAYLPTGTINVASGVTLAIDPQVVIKPSGTTTVFSVDGTLNVVGSNSTAGRVIFTSRRDDNPSYGGDTTPNDGAAPQAGDWGGIQFNDSSVDLGCVLRNVLFQFGASAGMEQGVITTVGASPRLKQLEFFQNTTAMTFKGDSKPVVDTTAILNCTQLPIVLSLISDPQFPNPGQITLANNSYNALGLIGETVAQNVVTRVRALGASPNMSYAPTGTLTIAFGAKWTIAPGVVIKFGRYGIDPIGAQVNIDGALVADGKPDSLIVLTSIADDAFGGDTRGDGALTQPAPGNWYGVRFGAVSNDAATVMDHCRLRYAGAGADGALKFTNAGPTITNTFVTSTSSYGVYIEGNSTPTLTNCQIDSSANVPVQMSLASDPVFNNVQFLRNGYTALGIIAESIAQDLLWRIRAVAGRNNMPYLLQGQLTTGLGATVTLQPGLTVKLTSSGAIFIQRAFLAEGRTVPESLIVFTSYRDDFYGGDTNNDSTATAPAPSDWNAVIVDGTAIDAQVRFKNCVFRYGGTSSTQGALRAVSASPTADSCLFAYNTVGLSAEGASNPTARGCSFLGNTNFGLNNSGGSFCVAAEGSWWGAASGPGDLSATADLCGLGSNAGAGDKVSNNVDYAPFAAGGVVNPLLGDVSLNGQVRAFDASLVLQYLVLLTPLSALQKLVADVSGVGGITGMDATYILQWVAGVITSFPAESNRAHAGVSDLRAAPPRQTGGRFEVALGAARRTTDAWELPVSVSGTAPIYSVELRLEGGSAAVLSDVAASGAAGIHERNVTGGTARVALAARDPLPAGEILVLRFAAGDAWEAPRLAWARVNETAIESAPPPAPGAARFELGAPVPNPASAGVTLSLGLSPAEAGARALVRVLDLSGRTVRTVLEGELSAGVHPLTWDLLDGRGRRVSPGLYWIRANAAGRTLSRPVMVVR